MSTMGSYDLAKRAMDLVASSSGLITLSPLIAASALAIRVSMGSPVLFKQKRPGLQGKPFELIKLRTMTQPVGDKVDVAQDHQRLTKVGAFLRSTSLDELPTLWNVLRGEMSLVGPRPLLMQYLDRYTPEQARRHEVKPGITGWAQVNGRNALSWEDKFKLDVWYVDHRSLALDLKILAMTLGKVFAREGISHQGEATMSEFMGSRGSTP